MSISKKNSTFAENLVITKQMKYQTRKIDIINNHDYIQFYELELNGKRLFSEFQEELIDAKDKKSFETILTLMENFSFNQKLPKEKFRPIKSIKRKNVYEFKKNNIRVYVLMQEPDMFVILGGYKADQKKDIHKVDLYTKELPKILTIQK